MSSRDGGPAFAVDGTLRGMTLRDYFAAAALQGTIAALGDYFIEQPNFMVIALECYRAADAMLKARDA